ncbi:PD-(D/E)XK motif protein [Actinomycetospora aeridis]|uniref:PD-(D/E)XK motif protein n=1 Tax=Actinomycetospora aeridis TaxID=3129231 RepID=A0ABU8NB28_9PSEU
MSIEGPELEKLWSAAQAEPPTTLFRTARTETSTPRGPVLVAVQSDGARHLLVPIDAKQTLREDVDGDAVSLRRRVLEGDGSYRTYAALALTDDRLQTLFTALCSEILVRIARTPDRAVAALRRTLMDWRALLTGARRTLGHAELAGLFGELTILRAMVAIDSGCVAFWTGPSRTAQDFHRGTAALEVKTTTSPEGRTVRIHGLGQLEGGDSGRLLLTWFRLRTDRGQTVPELVDEILEAVDDETGFLTALGETGYSVADRETYARHTFDIVERRTYEVGPGFPRITAPGLTGDATLAGLDGIHYDLDLDSAQAALAAVDVDPARAFLEHA